MRANLQSHPILPSCWRACATVEKYQTHHLNTAVSRMSSSTIMPKCWSPPTRLCKAEVIEHSLIVFQHVYKMVYWNIQTENFSSVYIALMILIVFGGTAFLSQYFPYASLSNGVVRLSWGQGECVIQNVLLFYFNP